ncbi:MAG: DUF2971 domain-containing protein [Bacteroidota bacterium]
MDNLRNTIAIKLRAHIIKMTNALGAHLDENFYSIDVISENLILREMVHEGKKITTAYLEEEYEYCLFNNLLYDKYLSKFYHYTSFESLFGILNSGNLHMSSLVGLNDKSEVNFVNNFMGSGFGNPNNPLTIAYHNNHFIFCLSENRDQLNQWRLYGDDASGVMLEFEIDHYNFPTKEMKISKVTYDLGLFALIKEWLEYCKDYLGVGFGFYQIDYWKFFYKNEDYKDENEVRLLIKNFQNEDNPAYVQEYFKLNRHGIIIPFLEINCIGFSNKLIKLKGVMLGPKCAEPELKIAQISYMISKKYPELEIQVSKSRIDHYR